MTTGYEARMYRDIERSRKALERIAAALERIADTVAPEQEAPPQPPEDRPLGTGLGGYGPVGH